MVDVVIGKMDFLNFEELEILSKLTVCTEKQLSILLENLEFTDIAFLERNCQSEGLCLCTEKPETAKLFRETSIDQ